MKLKNLADVFFAAHCEAVRFDWRNDNGKFAKKLRVSWNDMMIRTGFNLKEAFDKKMTHEDAEQALAAIIQGMEPMTQQILAQLKRYRDVGLN